MDISECSTFHGILIHEREIRNLQQAIVSQGRKTIYGGKRHTISAARDTTAAIVSAFGLDEDLGYLLQVSKKVTEVH